jgi:hypothetical protein
MYCIYLTVLKLSLTNYHPVVYFHAWESSNYFFTQLVIKRPHQNMLVWVSVCLCFSQTEPLDSYLGHTISFENEGSKDHSVMEAVSFTIKWNKAKLM